MAGIFKESVLTKKGIALLAKAVALLAEGVDRNSRGWSSG